MDTEKRNSLSPALKLSSCTMGTGKLLHFGQRCKEVHFAKEKHYTANP